LNDQGEEVKTTFLPTGGKDRLAVAQVKISTDGIYILGMADRQFNLSGEYENTIQSEMVRAVLMKYNFNHELLWIADSGLDQAIFGSGLQSLVVGEDFVCIASGGTSFSVSSSCAHSEWPYQISSFHAESGERQWRRLLDANDVTRITDLVLVGEEWLWVGGYSRGDLSTGNSHLDIQPNYLNCSYNDFLMCINVREHKVSYFKHSDPSRAKFIQDLSFHDDHLYALSMVYEESGFPMPIWANNGRWNVQIDKFTNGGVKVDSLIWPTAMSASYFSDLLRYHKFSFDFHPEGGTVLSANRLLNGRLDGFYSPPSTPGATRFNSWLLQRRDIDELESASLPLPPVSKGDFKIYPNPLYTDALVLELSSQDVEKYDQLIMTDLHGRVVSFQNLSGPFRSRLISVDGTLSNGTYLIQLVGSSKSVVKKMVLQR
ncbi:MAG TPA: T9SS type A sorting domain-containing protein, partial [Cryomorphaceae bacterium]|nr:T9SS type A sorting domain-containing protein [Cryomorphaceae bacterium]